MSKVRFPFTVAAVLAITLVLSKNASAATQYWDSDANAAGNNVSGTGLGGSGTWNTSTSNWWDGASGTDAPWVNGNDAQIKGSSGTLTLGSNITAGAITMGATNAFTITPSGGNTISWSSLTVSPTGGVQTTLSGGYNGTDMTIISNNGAGLANNFAIGSVGGNTVTNINLNGTQAGTTSASRLAFLINNIGSVPGTATFNMNRNLSQVLFNVAGNHGNVANNFVLNAANLPGAFEGWIGALASATVNLTGTVSGNGGLTFGLGVSGGAGVITLSNNSTYNGATRFLTAATGVQKLGVNDALPTTTGLSFGQGATPSGSFDLNGFNQTVTSLASGATTGAQNGIANTQGATATSILTIDGSATTSYTGPFGSVTNATNMPGTAADLAKIKLVLSSSNTGQLTMATTAGVAYSGGTDINGGTLVVSNTSGSGTGTGNVSIGALGTLKFGDGGANGNISGNITDGGNVVFNRNDAFTFGGSQTISGTGNVTQAGGTGGTGNLTLNNANTYSGTTRSGAGTLTVGHSLALQKSTLDMNGADTGAVSFGVANATLGGLSGSRNLTGSTGTLKVGNNNNSTTYSGVLGGSGALEKVGSGTLELTNNNTYAGNTTVTGGTLLANNTTGSATSGGSVTVGSGGTLGGTGSVSGAVTVQSGGTLSPGASIESLGSGAVTFSSGSTFKYEVNTLASLPVGADLLNATGSSLSIAANVILMALDLNPNPNAISGPTYKYTMIAYSDGGNVNYDPGAFSGLPELSVVTFTPGGKQFRIRYRDTSPGGNFASELTVGGNNRFVTLTAVPELGSFITMGLVGCCAFGAVCLGKRFGFKAMCL